ncbi:MAG: HesA/MoeB/ThiF family protein [Archaeoglobaceae archaeon]
MNRYHRQVSVPQFGEEGQKKLSSSKIMVVGAGGLGSPVIQYLAAAGVGELSIVDGDVVKESNLQRQVIHAGNIGLNKAISAQKFVENLNPGVRVTTHPFFVDPNNVLELVENCDVVISCPDNFRVRYLLNDACRILNRPIVHAAIYGFEGEAMTINTVNGSPCYRCLFPRAPQETDSGGVMGFTAGLFGCIQAAEALKLIAGLSVLTGKYMRGDLLSMEFFTTEIKQNPNCPVCTQKLSGIYPQNYEGTCEVTKFI